jgi:hypothetical protein
MSDHWYYTRDGQSVGPVSRAQLIAELLRSPYWHQERVWKPEYSDWQEAGSVDELSSELIRVQLQQLAQPGRPGARGASVSRTVLVYAGLAVFGIVSAIIYRFLF